MVAVVEFDTAVVVMVAVLAAAAAAVAALEEALAEALEGLVNSPALAASTCCLSLTFSFRMDLYARCSWRSP